ncbi:hypothetical protein BDV33DRAFT_186096 [Aspergillus novoparasiticus]|uniref:Uncharacterized protein n=1 Tax=Aspergillus novoparasiticus TaxID=986946 RepID=A0A5N6E6R5_9EURO|nr:hypothetical protein BDV33DRAFT_186096 [Aspergillus novoparasiticus]
MSSIEPSFNLVESIPKMPELVSSTTSCLDEVFDFIQSLHPSPSSTIAVFKPTHGFERIVETIRSEQEYSKVSFARKPKSIYPYRTQGLVYFPQQSTIGRKSFAVLIPLRVHGSAYIGGKSIETDCYYHIFQLSNITVSEGGKLVALVITYG